MNPTPITVVLALLCACATAEPRPDERPAVAGPEPTTARPERPELAEAAPTEAPLHDPVVCAGEEELTLEGVTIDNPDGPGVQARGECRVSIVDSEVRGSTHGVDAGDAARVVLERSRVSGGVGAVVSSGRAHVVFDDTEAPGEVRLGGPSEGDSDG